MLEKKARAEDAIHACRGAVQQGVVVGGGVALLRAAAANASMRGDQTPAAVAEMAEAQAQIYLGCGLLLDAMREPALQIARNAGHSEEEARRLTLRTENGHPREGFDAARGQHVDLMAAGVVDPAKVVQVALSKAASIGALLLTTEALIADAPEPSALPPANPATFRLA
jgi:chaperonin GroEL